MTQENLTEGDKLAAYQLIAEEQAKHGHRAARVAAWTLLGYDPGLSGLLEIVRRVNQQHKEPTS